MARQIVVEIVGDERKFTTATERAVSTGGKFQNTMKGIAVGLGVGVFNMASNAIGGLVSVLGEADAAFQEDARSQGVLAAALKANIPNWDGQTAAIEEVIASQMRLGFGDEEQRDSLANLAAITKDVTEAQKLQAQAMDLARLKGMSLETASDLLGKVYSGNLGTLSRYGIVLGDNATKEEALAAIQQMAAGQAEAYATGPLGKQEAAQLRTGEAMEKLGAIVNSVSSVALPILADALTVLMDWLTKVAAFVGTNIIPVLNNVARVVIPPLSTAVRVLGTLFGAEFSIIVGVVQGAVTALRAAISAISTAFSGMGRIISGVWNGVVGAVKGAINSVIGAVNTVIRALNSIQIHIPSVGVGPLKTPAFNWNGLQIRQLAYLHTGGIVPGPTGADVLSILQAGERVIPRNDVGSRPIIVQIENFLGASVDEFADRLGQRLRLQGVM